jgi:radical SAM protein with 4Fe4S-binding SPASM domain
MKKIIKTKVNPGFYQFLGTDKLNDAEKSFGPEYFDYRKKWKEYPEKRIVKDFPLHLDIESTNNCNLRCIMCGRNFMKEKLGRIDFKLFKKIIDEGAKYNLPSIKLNYRGEPLLHPKISEMVKYAKEKGIIEVQFNTNGFLLSEKKAKELIRAGLDRIIFSFDGATKKTYEKIRRGSNFERVVDNIKNLVALRNKMKLERPLVRVQMVKMKENGKEAEKFIEMWQPVANRVGLIKERNPLGSKKKNKGFACPQIWQRLMICWDGEVRMCCGDWYGEVVLGNVKKEKIHDIWHSEKLKKIRKLHAENNFNKIPVCAKCEINTPRADKELEKLAEKYNKNQEKNKNMPAPKKLKNKAVILIAVRMKSTRLPKKVLLQIEDKPAIEHLFSRLKLAKIPQDIVVCTTVNKEDDILVEIAKKNKVKYFRGSEKDVLARFLGAIDREKADIIIRVTGDNILVDPCYLDKAIQYHIQEKADYTSMRGLPSGVKCEVMSSDALRKIHKLAEEPQFTEYLTWFFTKNPAYFKIVDMPVEKSFQRNFRLTLDTPEDLKVLRIIFKNFYKKNNPVFTTEKLISFLDENPEVLKINAMIKPRDFTAINVKLRQK